MHFEAVRRERGKSGAISASCYHRSHDPARPSAVLQDDLRLCRGLRIREAVSFGHQRCARHGQRHALRASRRRTVLQRTVEGQHAAHDPGADGDVHLVGRGRPVGKDHGRGGKRRCSNVSLASCCVSSWVSSWASSFAPSFASSPCRSRSGPSACLRSGVPRWTERTSRKRAAAVQAWRAWAWRQSPPAAP